MQRGSRVIVMRVIPSKSPSFAEPKLPAELQNIGGLRNGIVLVTGPTGSGKSSTLAAINDLNNKQNAYHVLTIEDPNRISASSPELSRSPARAAHRYHQLWSGSPGRTSA